MLDEIEKKFKVIYFINWHILDLVVVLTLAVFMSEGEIIIIFVLLLVVGYIIKELYETQQIIISDKVKL